MPAIAAGSFDKAEKVIEVKVIVHEDGADAKVGDTLALTEVPARFVSRGSSYSVHVAPDDVPPNAVGARGNVSFEIHVSSPKQSWVTFVSSRMVSNEDTGDLDWVDPLEELPKGARSAAVRVAHNRSATVPVITDRAELGRARIRSGNLVPVPVAQRTVARTSEAALHPCRTRYARDRNRSTTIGTSYPKGASRSWMEVSYSHGGTFGMAVGAGDGAFKAGGTRSVSGGWGFQWNEASYSRSYRIHVNYHKYKKEGLCSFPIVYWSPHIETGGATQNRDGVSRPGWRKYCAPVAKGIWTRWRSDGNAYYYGAAVKFKKVIGIDLSGEKQYSSDHKIRYRIKGRHPKKLCGNNDYPSRAGKVIERRR